MIREKELRLALVCYGGISLAVYMHGITKEIWRLAKASRNFHDAAPPHSGSQGVYRALLEEIEAEHGLKLRVLVDIIAGASAGGINGIFLAQAISTGQSLEPLTDLWLMSADIDALLDPEHAPWGRLTKIWALPIVWLAQRRSGEQISAMDDRSARREVRAKLSRFVRSRWFEPPFGGARFSSLMFDAFDAMMHAEKGPRLLPDGQPLDLFVTVTDFAGHAEALALNSPPKVMETEHRLIFPFTDHGRHAETLAHPGELAYAARATSSFPGAFPPFTVAEMDKVLAKRGAAWPGRAAFLQRILPRQAENGTEEQAVLIDGSVLVNAPFGPAIDALRERPARRQVDRRFVYIDPNPGGKNRAGRTGAVPGFFQTIIGAISELPRQQPIRDNLESIAERSRRIERMNAIITAIRSEVEAQVEALFGYTLFLDHPTVARLGNWRRRAQNAAASKAGYGYAAYGHVKLAGVIDLITTMLQSVGGDTGDDERREGIKALVTAAISARGMTHGEPTFSGGTSPATINFLRNYDLGFRIRRLRMLARRLGEVEADYEEAQISALREAIYACLAVYLECKRTETHMALRPAILAMKNNAEQVMDGFAASLNLKALDEETDARLAGALAKVSREVRRPMLLAYLGFPYYDVATLPLLQGEGVDEFDTIKVDRISPDDAAAIRRGGAEATLKGIQFNSFGAFFSRSYRENDYLWGRLHGAERLIDIIASTLPAAMQMSANRVAAAKRAAFLAILDEEEPKLTAIAALIATLRNEIG